MPTRRKPSYLLHQPTGQARVRIDGRDHYLGKYGSPESRERYDDLIAEWFAKQGNVSGYTLTIDELCLLYLDYATGYYTKDGKPTREADNIRAALRVLIRLHGTTRARDFGPKKLRAVRDAMVGQPDRRIKSANARTVSRQYINAVLRRIRRMFNWAAAEELVPITVYQSLQTVDALKRGRTQARESKGVSAVDDTHINAVLPHVSPQVAAMIELQRLTGMRPAEVMEMRPADVTIRTDGIWTYRPRQHKNAHHDIERIVFIGPKGQKILRPWLDRNPDEFCFSPREAVEHRRREMRARRKTPVQPSQQDRSKKHPKWQPGPRYSETAYRQSIQRACRKVNVSVWSPNQLRHAYGTVVRQQFGLEASQVTLGHVKADVTQIYAQRD